METRNRDTSRSHAAFTLIELLVVISIIAVLVAITFGVASSVADSGRQRATEGVLRSLDETLDIYIAERGQIPPAWVEFRNEGAGAQRFTTRLFPMADGVGRASGGRPLERIDSVAFYLIEASTIPQIESLLIGIDPQFLRNVRLGVPQDASADDSVLSTVEIELRTMLDAWGNPIRIVHPRFDGLIRGDSEFGTVNTVTVGANNAGFITAGEAGVVADGLIRDKVYLRQLRRLAPTREAWQQLTPAQIEQNFVGGIGDSDGGICPSPRPYFYSAGPDGDPATTDDNVYTVSPRFPDQSES
jgi:prepilin-type N-terminal cleavage/methylation domain-containing protein